MKKLCMLVCAGVMAGCSAPRSIYYFDHVSYQPVKSSADTAAFNPTLTQLAKEDLTASLKVEPALPKVESSSFESEHKIVFTENSSARIHNEYKSLSNREKKALRKEFRNEIRTRLKANRLTNGGRAEHVNALDEDLKFAIIFGSIGVTFGLFAGVGTAFWVLAVVSLIVGLVFFIRWVLRQ